MISNATTTAARRMHGMSVSPIRAMTGVIERAGGINLAQGLCRVAPPAELLDEALARIRTGPHTYGDAAGAHDLRVAIAEKLRDFNGLAIDPETELVVSIGATGALNAVLSALFDPGDGVLLFEPYYGYHHSAVRLHDLDPQPVPCGRTLALEPEAVREAIEPNTRAMILCTPANPSGIRFDREMLRAIEAIAVANDLLVITDEIYEHIYFDERSHISPASLPGLADRTLTISGLSKTFSVPGWRLGYVAGPADLIRPIHIAADALFVCPPVPLQHIAEAALRLPAAYYSTLRTMYRDRMDTMAAEFERAGLQVRKPAGGYYLLCDFTDTGFTTGTAAAQHLLENHRVATVPGEAFCAGPAPFPFTRACFSVPLDDIARLRQLLRGFAIGAASMTSVTPCSAPRSTSSPIGDSKDRENSRW
ncbi:pyridoxal phosphate-dependent aminotransferase [Nocardia beijingensis]|uniref:Aminotransferase n=1 Tax=Nocardia beijingensis TaxID=95162 RepID=A0ABW7W8V1_9NOCA